MAYACVRVACLSEFYFYIKKKKIGTRILKG